MIRKKETYLKKTVYNTYKIEKNNCKSTLLENGDNFSSGDFLPNQRELVKEIDRNLLHLYGRKKILQEGMEDISKKNWSHRLNKNLFSKIEKDTKNNKKEENRKKEFYSLHITEKSSDKKDQLISPIKPKRHTQDLNPPAHNYRKKIFDQKSEIGDDTQNFKGISTKVVDSSSQMEKSGEDSKQFSNTVKKVKRHQSNSSISPRFRIKNSKASETINKHSSQKLKETLVRTTATSSKTLNKNLENKKENKKPQIEDKLFMQSMFSTRPEVKEYVNMDESKSKHRKSNKNNKNKITPKQLTQSGQSEDRSSNISHTLKSDQQTSKITFSLKSSKTASFQRSNNITKNLQFSEQNIHKKQLSKMSSSKERYRADQPTNPRSIRSLNIQDNLDPSNSHILTNRKASKSNVIDDTTYICPKKSEDSQYIIYPYIHQKANGSNEISDSYSPTNLRKYFEKKSEVIIEDISSRDSKVNVKHFDKDKSSNTNSLLLSVSNNDVIKGKHSKKYYKSYKTAPSLNPDEMTINSNTTWQSHFNNQNDGFMAKKHIEQTELTQETDFSNQQEILLKKHSFDKSKNDSNIEENTSISSQINQNQKTNNFNLEETESYVGGLKNVSVRSSLNKDVLISSSISSKKSHQYIINNDTNEKSTSVSPNKKEEFLQRFDPQLLKSSSKTIDILESPKTRSRRISIPDLDITEKGRSESTETFLVSAFESNIEPVKQPPTLKYKPDSNPIHDKKIGNSKIKPTANLSSPETNLEPDNFVQAKDSTFQSHRYEIEDDLRFSRKSFEPITSDDVSFNEQLLKINSEHNISLSNQRNRKEKPVPKKHVARSENLLKSRQKDNIFNNKYFSQLNENLTEHQDSSSSYNLSTIYQSSQQNSSRNLNKPKNIPPISHQSHQHNNKQYKLKPHQYQSVDSSTLTSKNVKRKYLKNQSVPSLSHHLHNKSSVPSQSEKLNVHLNSEAKSPQVRKEKIEMISPHHDPIKSKTLSPLDDDKIMSPKFNKPKRKSTSQSWTSVLNNKSPIFDEQKSDSFNKTFSVKTDQISPKSYSSQKSTSAKSVPNLVAETGNKKSPLFSISLRPDQYNDENFSIEPNQQSLENSYLKKLEKNEESYLLPQEPTYSKETISKVSPDEIISSDPQRKASIQSLSHQYQSKNVSMVNEGVNENKMIEKSHHIDVEAFNTAPHSESTDSLKYTYMASRVLSKKPSFTMKKTQTEALNIAEKYRNKDDISYDQVDLQNERSPNLKLSETLGLEKEDNNTVDQKFKFKPIESLQNRASKGLNPKKSASEKSFRNHDKKTKDRYRRSDTHLMDPNEESASIMTMKLDTSEEANIKANKTRHKDINKDLQTIESKIVEISLNSDTNFNNKMAEGGFENSEHLNANLDKDQNISKKPAYQSPVKSRSLKEEGRTYESSQDEGWTYESSKEEGRKYESTQEEMKQERTFSSELQGENIHIEGIDSEINELIQYLSNRVKDCDEQVRRQLKTLQESQNETSYYSEIPEVEPEERFKSNKESNFVENNKSLIKIQKEMNIINDQDTQSVLDDSGSSEIGLDLSCRCCFCAEEQSLSADSEIPSFVGCDCMKEGYYKIMRLAYNK